MTTKRQYFKSLSAVVLAATLAPALTGPARAAHPEVLVTPADRAAMTAKVQDVPWAHDAYAQMKGEVDHYVTLCQRDPDFVTSRLFMNWQTHATQPVVLHERYVRGEGHAPVPTPHFAGARDWATPYHLPASIEDWRPHNDQDGKIWLLDGSNQGAWVDPGITGRIIEVANSRILRLAANAGFLYWLTGDEKYAAFGSHILMTYMDGFQYVNLPKDLGPKPNTIIGYNSFEVIHEEIMPSLGLAYDFLHDYLMAQGQDVGMVQAQLKRLSDRVIDGGGATGNWDLNQVNNFIEPVLALEDDSAYGDHKGRQYYIDIILNARLPHQTGIVHVIQEGYDAKTALWPEAPGYAFGTTPQMILFSTLLGSTPQGKALAEDPLLTRALLAQLDLLYPNGWSVGVGDTDNTRVRADGLELAIAAARKRGDADTENRLTAALQREIDGGFYDRSKNADLIALTQYVGTLKKVPPASADPAPTYLATPINYLLQRSVGVDADHGLAVALYGTGGGHVHANGMAIELYGAGLVLGADPGRGASYWTKDHGEYYSQPPAHNTVIVNDVSDYSENAKPQHEVMFQQAEPLSGKPALSPDVTYAEGAFHYDKPAADQQRTLAVVRTGPKSGFYFDVFRSRAQIEVGSFHDYLYHDIGQSLALTSAQGAALPLAPSILLGSKQGDMKGYDYFTNEQSADYAGDLHGTFTVQMPDKSTHMMGLWMLGGPGRRVFSVAAPKDNAAREALPKDIQTLPMPTLLVRQQGDAWRKPFVAVYEPYLGADGPSIQTVRAARVDGDAGDLAACVVEGKSDGNPYTITLVQDDAPTGPHTVEGHTFHGSFGAVVTRGGQVAEIYLGHGTTLSAAGVRVTAATSEPTDAVLIRGTGGWRYSSSTPIKVALTFPTKGGRSTTVTSLLPAGKGLRLTVSLRGVRSQMAAKN